MTDEFDRNASPRSFQSPLGSVNPWLAGGFIALAVTGVFAFLNQDKILEWVQSSTTSQESAIVVVTQQTQTTQIGSLECPSGSIIRKEVDSASQQTRVRRNLFIVPGTDGKCICKDNYVWNQEEGICKLDCSTIIRQLNDLRKSSSAQGSPEILQEIQGLEEQIIQNRCLSADASLMAQKCKEYQNNANQALLSKQFLAYYDYSKKYIDQNCSGNNTNVCINYLAQAKILNGLEDIIKDPMLLETLQKEKQKLQTNYYSNTKCNQFETRCVELEPKFGGSVFAPQNALAALSVPLNLEGLTPGAIFKDNREYYDRYCTCNTLVSKYPTSDSIPPNEQDKFYQCFTLLYPNKVETPEVNTQQEMFGLE